MADYCNLIFPVFSEFTSEIRNIINKHRMFAPGDRVLAGVSGGADSVCLLLVLKELEYDVSVAHLNHGLRGAASDEDEEFTRRLAERLGVRFFSRKVALVKPSVEAVGREKRRKFFSELVRDHGFTKVALAHTRDDRVETFLMNLLRGSGVEGLVSMAPVAGNGIRPLIETSREQIEAYLKERNQDWRTDESNFDTAFARNRLRHGLIPTLVSEFNPNIQDTLARTVEILEAENAWMQGVTDRAMEALTRPSATLSRGERALVLDAPALRAEPVGLVRRLIREALRRAGSDLRDVTFDHVESVRGLLETGKSGKFVQIPGELQVFREFDNLVFRKPLVPAAEYEYQLQIPGEVHIPELGKIFRAEIIGNEGNQTGPGSVLVDAASVGPCVIIRNWKPGDYYRPVGLPAGKLKKLFQRARIPRSHRTNWPVVVADSTIVWVASFPVSREFVPGGRSQKLVVIEERESKGCGP
jgi:tRNA(Ile)-lysidine synthase